MELQEKQTLLDELKQELEADDTLPLRGSNLVFGEGDINSQVMFIGEAPGFHEDRLGRPFVGRAGELLTELIQKIGWKREDVYITNIIKRRPPENRDPLPEEIEAYKPFLTRQIDIISPRVVVPLGRFSMNYFLPEAKITRDQGKIFHVDGHIVVPLFHPAAALRSTEVLKTLTKSFEALPRIIEEVQSGAIAPENKKPVEVNPQQQLFSL